MMLTDLFIFVILGVAAALSYYLKKLTLVASFTGVMVGIMIFKGGGGIGLAMLALFFVAGTTATAWQAKRKADLNTMEQESGKRTAGQVLANGGVAAMLCTIAWVWPEYRSICQLMMAGSLASATADTLSSELGTVYGRRFFNIITFKKDQRGLDGVVSVEGTLIGLAGATLIATVYSVGNGFDIDLLLIVLGGFVGNVADSVLGATLERRGLIGNNVVNFLNTLVGALVCLALSHL